MELVETIIDFKSIPKNYDKEESGKKSNTVRMVEPGDDRFVKLYDMAESGEYGLVRVTNTESAHKFIRRISDVTKFGILVIVSWHPDDVGE